MIVVYRGESDPYNNNNKDRDNKDEEADSSIYRGEDKDNRLDNSKSEPPPKLMLGVSNSKSYRLATKVQRLPLSGIYISS